MTGMRGTDSSFSGDAKDALARDIPASPHCRSALLAALTYYGSPDGISVITRRNSIARLIRHLLLADMRGVEIDAHITGLADRRLRGATAFRLVLPVEFRSVPAKPTHKCDRIMELRGAFLACGSLAASVSGYHLEFVLRTRAQALRLAAIMRSLSAHPKLIERRARPVLYFKEFDAVADLLATIGAHAALLSLEDVRALRETKNRIHRLVNTEAANLDRTAVAAAQQSRTVALLESAYGMGRLTPPLREIAELRQRFPDESLAELGNRCNPPISKPTVASRFAALNRLAAGLGSHDKEHSKQAR